jgi:hypothetical protein
VKVVWDGATGENLTWELESKIWSHIQSCLLEVNFRGRKFYKLGRVVTPVLII